MWADMDGGERAAVLLLGWTDSSWDTGKDVKPFLHEWKRMNQKKQLSAMVLGMDESDFLQPKGRNEARKKKAQQRRVDRLESAKKNKEAVRRAKAAENRDDWHMAR
jgi:hypothetical protein